MAGAAISYRTQPHTRLHAPKTLEERRNVRQRLLELDDSAVVTAYLAGSHVAFTELYERYERGLSNFLFRVVGDREKVEDIVQETYLRVYRHLHRFDRSKKFSTWLFTIAANLARNELRNRRRSPLILYQTYFANEDEDRPLQFSDSTKAPDRLYHKRHLREVIDWGVLQLSEHHREAFVLRELEGKSYQEIAEITEVNLGTVKSRINRARTAFALIIEPYLD